MIPFEQLQDDARIWSYQSDRLLSITEVNWIKEQLEQFLPEWAAHGTKLKAYGDVLNAAHVVLVVDESAHNASGCSIDSSVRFMKSLEKELGVSFFNRLSMLVEDDGELKYVRFSDLISLPESCYIYNNMVTNVGEFKANWKVYPSFYKK